MPGQGGGDVLLLLRNDLSHPSKPASYSYPAFSSSIASFFVSLKSSWLSSVPSLVSAILYNKIKDETFAKDNELVLNIRGREVLYQS